jgi:hypothetical protein
LGFAAGKDMNPFHHLFKIWKGLRQRVAFHHYKFKQRRELKKQKANDKNVYPLS